jgi:malate dehydrogenase (oxaloacetate-decarboxylating)
MEKNMDYGKKAVEKHREWRGKLEIIPKMPIASKDDLSIAYTPGVAQPCLEIQKDPSLSYELTGRWNTVAVVTDGTAVLGLGDIGPEASMPVMEGKCVLFKAFGDVDAVPICIRSKEVDVIVETVALLAGSFGGVNLEDISAPRCFEIERKLKERCDIPIFHDDQHGTAVVVLAAMLNALKIVGKNLSSVRVVTSGAGAAGVAIIRLLMAMGLKDVIMCDRQGAIWKGREGLNEEKVLMAEMSNRKGLKGSLAEVIKGADIFIGVSAPGTVTQDMIKSMAPKPILFPMANPTPEIMPDLALAAGAAIVGTGRSDFPNQINNVLAFPGIFRGVFDVRADDINDSMKIAAAFAIADLVQPSELKADYILPAAFDPRVKEAVAKAVAKAAIESGAAIKRS